MTERTYLDWNATAPLRPEARAVMLAALDAVGNPSSVHAEGRAARRVMDEARRRVAALVGAEPANVIFTSGGTEANATALSPSLRAADGRPVEVLLVSAIEHPSVLTGGRFSADAVMPVSVGTDGVVDLGALERHLAALGREGRRALVSLMHANNETGVVQPVAAAAGLVHAAGGLLHVDAVQTAGRIPCDINALGADLLTVSGHKLGGPKGVGALIRRSEAVSWPEPLIKGGGQERGTRAGTENVAAIAGFGAAAAAVRDLAEGRRLTALRDRLEAALVAEFPQTVVFGAQAERLPNTSLFALPGVKAETAVIGLDLARIAVSSGAACSSGKVAASHVLAAMGVPAVLARGAVRVSLGYGTQGTDIERFLAAWRTLAQALSKDSRDIAA